MPRNGNNNLGDDIVIDSSQMLTVADLEDMYDLEVVKQEEQKRAEKMLMSKINAERVKKETKVIKERVEEFSKGLDAAVDKLDERLEKLSASFKKNMGLDKNVLESNAGDAYKGLHYDCEKGVDELSQMAMRKNTSGAQEHLKDVFARLVLHDIIRKERSLRPETSDGKQVAGPVEEALNQPGVLKQFLEGIKNSKSFKDYFGPEIGAKEIEKAFRENGPSKIGRNLYSESKVFGLRTDEKQRDIGDEAITNYRLSREKEEAKERDGFNSSWIPPDGEAVSRQQIKKPPKQPEPLALGSSMLRL